MRSRALSLCFAWLLGKYVAAAAAAAEVGHTLQTKNSCGNFGIGRMACKQESVNGTVDGQKLEEDSSQVDELYHRIPSAHALMRGFPTEAIDNSWESLSIVAPSMSGRSFVQRETAHGIPVSVIEGGEGLTYLVPNRTRQPSFGLLFMQVTLLAALLGVVLLLTNLVLRDRIQSEANENQAWLQTQKGLTLPGANDDFIVPRDQSRRPAKNGTPRSPSKSQFDSQQFEPSSIRVPSMQSGLQPMNRSLSLPAQRQYAPYGGSPDGPPRVPMLDLPLPKAVGFGGTQCYDDAGPRPPTPLWGGVLPDRTGKLPMNLDDCPAWAALGTHSSMDSEDGVSFGTSVTNSRPSTMPRLPADPAMSCWAHYAPDTEPQSPALRLPADPAMSCWAHYAPDSESQPPAPRLPTDPAMSCWAHYAPETESQPPALRLPPASGQPENSETVRGARPASYSFADPGKSCWAYPTPPKHSETCDRAMPAEGQSMDSPDDSPHPGSFFPPPMMAPLMSTPGSQQSYRSNAAVDEQPVLLQWYPQQSHGSVTWTDESLSTPRTAPLRSAPLAWENATPCRTRSISPVPSSHGALTSGGATSGGATPSFAPPPGELEEEESVAGSGSMAFVPHAAAAQRQATLRPASNFDTELGMNKSASKAGFKGVGGIVHWFNLATPRPGFVPGDIAPLGSNPPPRQPRMPTNLESSPAGFSQASSPAGYSPER